MKNPTSNAALDTLLQSVCEQYENRVALSSEVCSLTYGELEKLAQKYCDGLLSLNLSDSAVVGVCLERSPRAVALIYGILKAGLGYLPLDSEYPLNRLEYMIEDSKTLIVVTDQKTNKLFQETKLSKSLFLTETDLQNKSNDPKVTERFSGDLAYIIYTSGTTGNPKGVAIGHEQVLELISWNLNETRVNETEKTLQFAPLSFDPSVIEIFTTLAAGKTVVLVDSISRKDPQYLLDLILRERIDRLFITLPILHNLAIESLERAEIPSFIKEITCGGDVLKIDKTLVEFFKSLPHTTFHNQYGPTEATVATTDYVLQGKPESWPELPPIGAPIGKMKIHILGEKMVELGVSEVGEVALSGPMLAKGYWNRAELSAQKFVTLPSGVRAYLTGDLGALDASGVLSFKGRIDEQVKVNGVRVELGEIESKILGCEGVSEVAVKLVDVNIGRALAAFYVGTVNESELRQELVRNLPAQYVPATFVKMESLPLTSNGKVDKKMLASRIGDIAPSIASKDSLLEAGIEQALFDLYTEVLGHDQFDKNQTFFAAGGTSLQAISLVRKIRSTLRLELSLAVFFEHSSLNDLLNTLNRVNVSKSFINKNRTSKGRQVAIVGLSCRFPGAESLEAYWELLKNNKEGIQFFDKKDLDPSLEGDEVNDPRYVSARGILNGVELFDANYFGLNPRVAELMDPQIRIMLEQSVHALEHAGLIHKRSTAKMGVYLGMSNNTYYPRNIVCHPDKIKALGDWTVSTLNEKDYIATHVAHKLGLKGPAISIHTACSTSLVAIAEAYKAIERGDCVAALAGGINIEAQRKSGHLFQEGGIRSEDGHCRPFDSSATGTVFSDGVGVVVLKDLDEAIRDGDQILALIKGVAVNNDGAHKMSFTAPGLEGQREVIESALTDAEIDPATIEMIECHGTATPIGDPIEVEALKMAYSSNSSANTKYLGSVKSNIGHTVTAAGAAGLIKCVLALKHKMIPATLHFKELNPEINLKDSSFKVASENINWQESTQHPRRASVSAFGVGGTNAHLLLEEYVSEAASLVNDGTPSRSELFVFSAKTARSLQKLIHEWSKHLANKSDKDLVSLASSLMRKREQHSFRIAIVAKSLAELKLKLEELREVEFKKISPAKKVIFALPGQGAQYLEMGQKLYRELDVFRKCCDSLYATLENSVHGKLKSILTNGSTEINHTFYTQPALYIFELALARTMISLGVAPQALIAHSVGEFVAAALAGVYSDESGLAMICKRAELMQEIEQGQMLSVRLPIEKLEEILTSHQLEQEIQIAAHNTPQLAVLAGTTESVQKVSEILKQQGIAFKELVTSHAFHSEMMRPMISPLQSELEKFKFKAAKNNIYSTLEGKKLSRQMDAVYFAEHAASRVDLVGAMKALCSDFHHGMGETLLIDIGPRQIMATMTKQIATKSDFKLNTISLNDSACEWESFLEAIGKIWSTGLELDLGQVAAKGDAVQDIPLYQFDRKRYWLENTKNKRGENVNTQDLLVLELQKVFAESSGFAASDISPDLSFLELGLDSLLLTQVAIELEKTFKVKVTFRQLMDELPNLLTLAAFLKERLPSEVKSKFESAPTQIAPKVEVPATPVAPVAPITPAPIAQPIAPAAPVVAGSSLEAIVLKQLELMSAQMNLLTGAAPSSAPVAAPVAASVTAVAPAMMQVESPKVEKIEDEEVKATVNTAKTAFGAQARINTESNTLQASELKSALNSVMDRYIKKTAKSKAFTQKYRAVNADPRVVTGFRPELKEMIYPVVVNRSRDQHLWDIDGNEYIDMTCGFGSNFFGNQNPRITKALHDQIDRGFEIGPQHELVGECAELISEFSGLPRAAFCNTGSEAVLGALRISRTATGRKKIVMFKGSYHGINDEVIVRGLAGGKAMPAAAGINKSSVNDILVLDYGTDESLEIIKDQIHEIAAVICEPVQSRRANFRPRDFLLKLREVTAEAKTALIFDEVITGFRIAPGGAQEFFGIKADIATYGKIVGGGMPIGVIAGTERFMDALDGGFWNYGDDSAPTAALTYFAGTFVRHPLALRAMREALLILKEGGKELYKNLNETAADFVRELNLFCSVMGAPIEIDHFGGVLKPRSTDNGNYNDLFYALMRLNGVHVYDGFPWFVTLAHSSEDLQQVVSIFKKCVLEMQELGLFATSKEIKAQDKEFLIPPIPEAKLGRDEMGMPAWFIPDMEHPGSFKKIQLQ